MTAVLVVLDASGLSGNSGSLNKVTVSLDPSCTTVYTAGAQCFTPSDPNVFSCQVWATETLQQLVQKSARQIKNKYRLEWRLGECRIEQAAEECGTE